MTSGIYKLEFADGSYYLGKSKNIERRWLEHDSKFINGSAARNMQRCFDIYGYPHREIVLEVHADHLDVIEPLLIENNWGPQILNTTKEVGAKDMQNEFLPLCQSSLGTICTRLLQAEGMVTALSEELNDMDKEYAENLEEIKNGTALKKAEKELKKFKEMFFRSEGELQRMKSRNFFQRLFNLT